MSSITTIIGTLPEAWAREYKPFLLRAQEFESSKQELIKYYLVSYVAHRAMIAYKSTPKEERESKGLTKYLFSVVDYLEALKATEPLLSTLSDCDGRTEVTRIAIQLFTQADDLEREGEVSEKVMKLFYTSSLLFEATRQFMSNDEMDPFASQKHKYAQVIALKMKKALASGTPYVSANNNSAVTSHPETPVVAIAGSPSTNDCVEVTNTFDCGRTLEEKPPIQTPIQPPTFTQMSQPQPHHQITPTSLQVPLAKPVQIPVPTSSIGSYVPSPGPTGKIDHNRIIDAQKYAKQAVSALQFYDQDNARKQLILALQKLDGVI
eukprot:Tbor_TRINITY_DN5409_c0_g1::TRINITY_DN5409_c0_g1_i1::g.24238::m.24238/K12199/VTA1, LIP5; vacuolar protein sorting-associated protein VTA1